MSFFTYKKGAGADPKYRLPLQLKFQIGSGFGSSQKKLGSDRLRLRNIGFNKKKGGTENLQKLENEENSWLAWTKNLTKIQLHNALIHRELEKKRN